MKKRMFALLLTLALLLCGCAEPPTPPDVAADGTPWGTDWTNFGAVLGIAPVEEWTEQRNEDVLAAEGMYFASWTWGEGELDAEGSKNYPAQVFLVISQRESAAEAEQDVLDWLDMARETYISEEAWTLEHTHGTFTMLPYRVDGGEGGFVRGMAAYGVHGDLAINLEFTCREDVSLDPEFTLTAFLDSIHFAE